MDSDNINLTRLLLWRGGISAAVLAVLYHVPGGAIPMALISPFIGAALAKPIVETFPFIAGHARRKAGGKYRHAFEGSRIVIVETGDERLALVSVPDMCHILDINPDGKTLRRIALAAGTAMTELPGGEPALTLAATIRFLEGKETAVSKRFRLWLDREVGRPLRNRLDALAGEGRTT